MNRIIFNSICAYGMSMFMISFILTPFYGMWCIILSLESRIFYILSMQVYSHMITLLNWAGS